MNITIIMYAKFLSDTCEVNLSGVYCLYRSVTYQDLTILVLKEKHFVAGLNG